MFIKNIYLKNFRNHTETNLPIHSRLVFFIGDNGEGKTNILEAIYFLSIFKSFRDITDENVVGWGKDHFFIKVNFFKDIDQVIEYGYSKETGISKKKIKLNNNIIEKKLDVIGQIKCIVFSPDDISIVENVSYRRKFLDSFISTIDKEYYISILEYNKILKHRNSLLKQISINYQKELEPWDHLLVEKAKKVMEKRASMVSDLSLFFQKNLAELSGSKDNILIEYHPNVPEGVSYLEKLRFNLQRDIKVKYTTVGLHKDNIFIGKGKKDVNVFGSQGQKRSITIALKTSIYDYISKTTNESPILLIDDIIRELDVKRREYFVKLLSRCGQVFFTTTDMEGISDYIQKNETDYSIYKVVNGEVKEQ